MHKPVAAFPGLAAEEQCSALCLLEGAGTEPGLGKLESHSADSSPGSYVDVVTRDKAG